MKSLYDSSKIQQQVVSIFLDLVKLSSPSKEEELVSKYIKEYLSNYDFVEVYEDDTANKIGGTTNNLIVKIKGSGEHIMFDAHMDTVNPCNDVSPIVSNGKITSDHTTILGADDKSGIAAMLTLVDLLDGVIEHKNITLVFTVCEENSLQGAKHLDTKWMKDVDYAYILDGEGPVGHVVTKTPYGCKGKLSIVGKESHAGVEPEKGINALYVAAQAITKLPMGRLNENTTCNIGVVNGGTATNVVMGEVSMMFEARSYYKEELEELVRKVKLVYEETANTYQATFVEDLTYGTPGYVISSEETILTKFNAACERAHVSYREVSCGGGSNANVYRQKGIDAITIATNMKDCHSLQESIEEKDLLELTRVILQLVL